MTDQLLTTAAATQIADRLSDWLLARAGRSNVYRVIEIDTDFLVHVLPAQVAAHEKELGVPPRQLRLL